MCGIVALVGRDGFVPDPARLRSMADALRHRGPDDSGVYVEGHVGLAVRRLAILDLTSGGHQPMVSEDGHCALAYNGEIFNYVELREQLVARGRHFRSTGDSEVLLAAWQEWGEDCLDKLNGMFAFVIHDRTAGSVFVARDRFGVKPLYLYRTLQFTLLASEIKAMRCVASPGINWSAASQYLVSGILDAGTDTLVAGVERFPAGACMTITPDGRERRRTWWRLPPQEDTAPPDLVERYAALFEDSVRLRMRSDVPVGVCLSGGMDSTSIICSMARLRASGNAAQRLLAFSFNVAEFDEAEFVNATIAQTGAELVPLTLTGREFWDRLPGVLAAQDEPTHSLNVLAQDGLMRLARHHGVTVVLTGEGADETAAGYENYFREYWYALLKRGRAIKALREMRAFAGAQGTSTVDHALAVAKHAAFRALGRIGPYRRAAQSARRSSLAQHEYFPAELALQAADHPLRMPANLDQALRQAVEVYPLPLYLRVLDRVSMAHSIEARDPFLDYRLVAFTFALPNEFKLRGPWNKWLLREAMRGRIPEVVRTRAAKFGFPVPMRTWIRDGVYEPVRDLLSSQRARQRGSYRAEQLVQSLERSYREAVAPPGELVRSVQFELWARSVEEAGAPSQPAA